jgi:hypothetical protein
VFSTQESLANFSTNFAPPRSPGVHLLVYAGPPSWQAKYDKHVVLYKKMWALYYMRDLYEYYILSDAEIKFVKSFDTYAWAQDYFSTQKTIYGRKSGHGWCDYIQRNGAWRYSEEERARLKEITKEHTVFFWFNEVPVVETKSALAYLDRYYPGPMERDPATEEFDWVSYAFYMILNHGFKLVDVEEHVDLSWDSADQYSIGEKGGLSREVMLLTKPHWALARAYNNVPKRFAGLDVFMTMHHDRNFGGDTDR